MVGHLVTIMSPLQMVLKMATNCRGYPARRVMVAHLADGPIGPPQKYFVWFRLGRVRGFRISSLCTNVPLYASQGGLLIANLSRKGGRTRENSRFTA